MTEVSVRYLFSMFGWVIIGMNVIFVHFKISQIIVQLCSFVQMQICSFWQIPLAGLKEKNAVFDSALMNI